jgi:hypothetical protein
VVRVVVGLRRRIYLAVRVYQNGEDVPPYYCRHLLASHKPSVPNQCTVEAGNNSRGSR